MQSNRIFQYALLVSFAVHGAIFLPSYSLILRNPNKKEEIRISYIKKSEDQAVLPDIRIKKEPLLRLDAKVTARKINPPPFIDKNEALPRRKQNPALSAAFNKPAVSKPDIIAVKKKITLPPVDTNKINNPSYINYYQIVREKIRRSAYQNYSGSQMGEVYLSFLISRKGELKDVRLAEDKSSGTTYLKEIARKSIDDSSPFPEFPQELDYPQLSFNIIISFEVE